MVVLCDLEKVVRTDAAKEERKIAEDIAYFRNTNKMSENGLHRSVSRS